MVIILTLRDKIIYNFTYIAEKFAAKLVMKGMYNWGVALESVNKLATLQRENLLTSWKLLGGAFIVLFVCSACFFQVETL